MPPMSAVGMIPARYGATRFPGKPLAQIAGLPMLQHVVQGARQARSLREVIVATDDARIAEACAGFGAPVIMTSPQHRSGTERLAEAAATITDDIVVNVQGDEPLIEGPVIDAAVAALRESPEASMSTLVHRADARAMGDPNRVKVALDCRGFALYFSRSPIPFARGPAEAWQHIGLYAYRRPRLLQIAALPPTPLEQAEQLEQLRVLEHGLKIRCAKIENWRSLPVDVPGDIPAAEAALAARLPPGRG